MNTQSWTILWLSLLLPAAAAAGTVYSWTDADGVTHFSESPPSDTTQDIRRFEIDTPPAVQPAVADDHFSVINQAARMQESRLENERARTERLQVEAEARRAQAEAQATTRIQIGTGILNPYTINPAEIAMLAATLMTTMPWAAAPGGLTATY